MAFFFAIGLSFILIFLLKLLVVALPVFVIATHQSSFGACLSFFLLQASDKLTNGMSEVQYF